MHRSTVLSGFMLIAFLPAFGLRLAVAQPALLQVRLYGGVEAHDFGLSDLKDWQRDQQRVMRQYDMPVEVVEAFPAHVGVRLEAVTALSSTLRVGLGTGYGSTGGRLHYADYTGEVYFDQVASRRHLSLLLEGRPSGRGPLPLWGTLQLRYNFSRVESESFLRLGDEAASVEEELTAHGVSLEPGIALEVHHGIAFVRLSAGLEYALTQGVQLDAVTNTFRYNGQTTVLHAEWTGPRVGITIGVTLPGT